MSNSRKVIFGIAVVVLGLAGVGHAAPAGDLQMVARTGQPVPGPDGGAKFTFFHDVSISPTGQVVLWSQETQFGVVAGTPGNLTRLMRGGDPAPGADGFVFAIPGHRVPMNAAGQFVFSATTSNTVDGQTTAGPGGIWSNLTGPLKSLALTGEPAPGAPAGSTFFALRDFPYPIVISDSGIAAFQGTISVPGDPTPTSATGIWAGGDRPLAKVALTGEQVPGLAEGTVYSSLSGPVINPSGKMAFRASVTGDPVGFHDGELILTASVNPQTHDVAVAPVVRSDSVAPGTGGSRFWRFWDPAISRSGKVAFLGGLDFSAPFDQRDGFWAGKPGNLNLVARSGTHAPGTPDDVKFDFFSFAKPLISDAGVSIKASLAGPGVTSDNRDGLWFGNSADDLALIARNGQPAPGTPAGVTFAWPTDFTSALNNHGQMAFVARLKGEGVDFSNDNGLFAYDPADGLHLVLREGDKLRLPNGDVRTIAGLNFQGGAATGDGRPIGLNDLGQLAFSADFAEGIDEAVFIANVGLGRLPGDADGNGVVDHRDFERLWSTFGKPGEPADGDFNGDGVVDFRDFQVLEVNFGQTRDGPTMAMLLPAGRVPEPAGMLALLGIAMMCGRRVSPIREPRPQGTSRRVYAFDFPPRRSTCEPPLPPSLCYFAQPVPSHRTRPLVPTPMT
jgi:hypothetical protein